MKRTLKKILGSYIVFSLLAITFMGCQQTTGGDSSKKENSDKTPTPSIDAATLVEKASTTYKAPTFSDTTLATMIFSLPSKIDVDGESVSTSWQLVTQDKDFTLTENSLSITRDLVITTCELKATFTYGDKSVTKDYSISVPQFNNFIWEYDGSEESFKLTDSQAIFSHGFYTAKYSYEKPDTLNNTIVFTLTSCNSEGSDGYANPIAQKPFLCSYELKNKDNDYNASYIVIKSLFDESKEWNNQVGTFCINMSDGLHLIAKNNTTDFLWEVSFDTDDFTTIEFTWAYTADSQSSFTPIFPQQEENDEVYHNYKPITNTPELTIELIEKSLHIEGTIHDITATKDIPVNLTLPFVSETITKEGVLIVENY